jgi:hypothetical protein
MLGVTFIRAASPVRNQASLLLVEEHGKPRLLRPALAEAPAHLFAADEGLDSRPQRLPEHSGAGVSSCQI